MFLDKDRVKDYFYCNIASFFWSFFLIFGAAIFVLYYIHIGYMPDFDMASSISLLAAVSATSIFLLLFIVVVGIMPGIFWDCYWNEVGGENGFSRRWKNREPITTVGALIIWFALPVLIFFISILGGLLYSSWLYSVLLLAFVVYYLCIICSDDVRLWAGFKDCSYLFFASLLSSMLAIIPFYFILSVLLLEKYDDTKMLYLIIFLSLFVLLMNVLVAAPVVASDSSANTVDENKLKKNALIGFIMLVVFFIATSSTVLIPKGIMQLYKFGNINASRVVLDRDGCLILKGNGLSGASDSDMCYIEGLLILSRLGEEYYLEISSNAVMKDITSDEGVDSTGNITDEKAGSTDDEVEISIDEPNSADSKSVHFIRVTMLAEHILSWSTNNNKS